MLFLPLLFHLIIAYDTERESRQGIFNIVRFPNTVCSSSSNLNGTCYTASECTSLSGTASGSCASSFGVCCVFTLSCGATTSANNTYATINSFSTSSDTDPCTYTYCKNNDDVCKLRIDYDSMVIADPDTVSSATSAAANAAADSINTGDCNTDTLTVSVPGFAPPPVICGYNTGQHMWVPSCPSCVTINIDIDTASTATTRSWTIRVTQYECGTNNLNIPEENCLQYHTAQTGSIASFNWDTSSTTPLTTTTALANAHLSGQSYDICIRRASGYCSICYSPHVLSTAASAATSFGLSAGDPTTTATAESATDTLCTGVTTISPDPAIATNSFGYGDYLEIPNFQKAPGTAGLIGANKICGGVFNSIISEAGHETLCSFTTPFRVGVRFDQDEAININTGGTHDHLENMDSTAGSGIGYTGFWLDYWQNTC